MPLAAGKVTSLSPDWLAKGDQVDRTQFQELETISALIRWAYSKRADCVALRHKKLGIWREFTSRQCYQRAKYFSLGLQSLGLLPGDKVGFIGDIEPELYWGMFGVWTARAAIVGIYFDSIATEVGYIVDNCEAKFVLAGDQEQVDKLLALRDRLPNVKNVIWWDPRGMADYRDPWLLSFSAVEELGKGFEREHPETLDEAKPDDVAAIYYTSGTTGLPKGCVHTHRSLLNMGASLLPITGPTEKDDLLAYWQPTNVAEPTFGSIAHLMTGIKLNMGEDLETFAQDLREVSPKYVARSPRLWEEVASLVQVRVGDAGWLKRSAYRMFLPVGYRVDEFALRGKPIPVAWRVLHYVAERLLFRPIRDKLGLARVKLATNGGSMLGRNTYRYLRALGINLREMYGSMEGGTPYSQAGHDVKLGSVGKAFPGVDAKLSPRDELLVKTPYMFLGYYRDPIATEKALDSEGWLHTGDAAHFDEDGNLFIVGRVDELGTLADGGAYSPQFIESELRFGAYIRDAMVVGGSERAYLAALVSIDFESVGKWAEKRGVSYTTFADLSQKSEIGELVVSDILRVNSALPEHARIRKYVVLPKEFDADEGELTRTRKLRRPFLEEKYRAVVDAVYDNRDEVAFVAQLTYQDGTTGTMEATVKVRSVANSTIGA